MVQAASRYSVGKVTLGRAAEEAGISVREMMVYLRERKIPSQYSLEDLEHDMKAYYGNRESR